MQGRSGSQSETDQCGFSSTDAHSSEPEHDTLHPTALGHSLHCSFSRILGFIGAAHLSGIGMCGFVPLTPTAIAPSHLCRSGLRASFTLV